MAERPLYGQRRLLRALERGWTRLERLLDRLTTSARNPLYHLGALAVFLLVVLAISGAYLTLFYRPGMSSAYETVTRIDRQWLGGLMRSVHVYAGNGLVLVILLHALKMLLSDRFWGARWTAWVSGWGLLLGVWVIGLMGYVLVWDVRAQWLMQRVVWSLGDSFALTFLGPEAASQTYALFVIVLFLHVFLAVGLVAGLLLHVMRVARPRVRAPRWLMATAAAVLLALSVVRPAGLAPPADLGQLVTEFAPGGWYLAVMPLVERAGAVPVLGVTALFVLAAVALPRLWSGRMLGPAEVSEGQCTGCELCAAQCPYEAIRMLPRPEAAEGHHDELALVDPALCVGCGLCVGVCSTAGMELAGLPSDPLRAELERALASARSEVAHSVIVFTCQRHGALGTLPDRATALPGTITTTPLGDDGAVVTCTLPCVGMVQPEWLRSTLGDGADGALVLSCPADDCGFREGPRWLVRRLGRRRALYDKGLRWLLAAPGARGAAEAALAALVTQGKARPITDDSPAVEGQSRTTVDRASAAEGTSRQAIDRPPAVAPADDPAPRNGPVRRLAHLLPGALLLTALLGLTIPLEQPISTAPPAAAALRVTLEHRGALMAPDGAVADELAEQLPPDVSAQAVMGGERHPVGLRVQIDARPVEEHVYRPGGLRREGAVAALERWPLVPGDHRVRLWLRDDDGGWRPVLDRTVTARSGEVVELRYVPDDDTFVVGPSVGQR